MKAAVYRQYGPPQVVHVEEVPTPAPKDGEVLIRVRASTVSSGDARVRGLNLPRGFGVFGRPMFGFFRPRQPILGVELAGEIEAIGAGVTKFKVGDRVFAFPDFGMGAHAEYRAMPENGLILPMPANASFEEAAAICFGGMTALGFLRDLGKVQAGESVLIIGASGAVGSAAVQLAKHLGAFVTGVTSTPNVERVRALGADVVIDYTNDDALNGRTKYDVIFETVGKAGYAECKAALNREGRLLLGSGTLPQLAEGGWVSARTPHKVVGGSPKAKVEDMRILKELVEAGAYKPMIDRTFPLEQIADAHAYVDTGRKKGSVVVTM